MGAVILTAEANTRISPDSFVPVAGNWLWPLLRGLVALAVGLAVTFTSHLNTPILAFLLLAGYTLLTGLLQWFFLYKKSVDNTAYISSVILAGVNTAVGVASLIIVFVFPKSVTDGSSASFGWGLGTPEGQTALFLQILIVWALLSGLVEIYLGLSRRGKIAEARDWIFSGGLTLLLALVALLTDPGMEHAYTIKAKGDTPAYEGVITGSITALGFFGIYLIILGVFLVIGAFSLKTEVKNND